TLDLFDYGHRVLLHRIPTSLFTHKKRSIMEQIQPKLPRLISGSNPLPFSTSGSACRQSSSRKSPAFEAEPRRQAVPGQIPGTSKTRMTFGWPGLDQREAPARVSDSTSLEL